MIEKYHVQITANALDDSLSNNAIGVISRGNIESDTIFSEREGISDGYVVTAQHFNNTDLEDCKDFIDDAQDATVDTFIEALSATDEDEKEDLYIQAFYNFGRLTHCVQDFYSHTNWVNLTGDEVSVWNESIENPNIDNPAALKTARYTGFSQFCDDVKFGILGYNIDYDKTYLGDKDLSHGILNKDEPGTTADKAFQEREGSSGFELACEDATLHTTQEWGQILEELDEQLDDAQYAQLMEELEGFSPTLDEVSDYWNNCCREFNQSMEEEHKEHGSD